MNQAELILLIVKIWASIGGVVAFAFLTFGMDQIDEDARDAYVFRPLIVPGILLIWPLVVWRWTILATGKDQWAKRYLTKRTNHKWFGMLMPVAIVAIIALGWSVRQTWPADFVPTQLAAPVENGQ